MLKGQIVVAVGRPSQYPRDFRHARSTIALIFHRGRRGGRLTEIFLLSK